MESKKRKPPAPVFTRTIQIRLKQDTFDRLEAVAVKDHRDFSALARIWIEERLEHETKRK